MISKLTKLIESNQGLVFSTDTLNVEHLLVEAYNFLNKYQPESNLIGEIESLYNTDNSAYPPTIHNYFYGRANMKSDCREEASMLWNEDFFELMNGLAPEGFYFGSHEGDGACIGFFIAA